MDNIYKNIEKYSPNKKRETLIVVDDMTAHMFSNKSLRGRKLNNYLVFITILFCCSKTF